MIPGVLCSDRIYINSRIIKILLFSIIYPTYLCLFQINLLNTLPETDRTKERLAEILEDRNLTFLLPLLRIQSDLWKQLKVDGDPNNLYKWIKENLDPAHFSDPGFISALATVVIKYITQVRNDFSFNKFL